jgi:CRISPR-associated protein Cas2
LVVIVLEKCPLALRGDLTKWLQEISLGVYVGQVSARVRDELWKRVCDECKNGRATLVYSARNEQHLNFKVHNTTWEPIDFDGIKLMLHPSPAHTKALGKKRMGWSDASVRSKARRKKNSSGLTEPDEYVVIDVETTGLDVDKEEIIEIAAIKVIRGEEAARFHNLVRSEKRVPKKIVELTGITDDLLNSQGVNLELALHDFISFVGGDIVVAHNATFDSDFIQASCEECNLDDFDNECIDTIALAKKKMPKAKNYHLSTLLDMLNLDNEIHHRAESDCDATLRLFRKLIKM